MIGKHLEVMHINDDRTETDGRTKLYLVCNHELPSLLTFTGTLWPLSFRCIRLYFLMNLYFTCKKKVM